MSPEEWLKELVEKWQQLRKEDPEAWSLVRVCDLVNVGHLVSENQRSLEVAEVLADALGDLGALDGIKERLEQSPEAGEEYDLPGLLLEFSPNRE